MVESGTCEKDSPHLLTALDELSNLILGNVKLPSENKEEIYSQNRLNPYK